MLIQPWCSSLSKFIALVLLPALGSVCSLRAAKAQQVTTVPIVLTQPVTDSGLQVTKGELISVTATGMMNWYTGSSVCNGTQPCVSTPDGISCPFPGFYAQNLVCWSLIGQIGNGPPFQVGSSLQNFAAPNSGELYLGVNDNAYGDNTPYPAGSAGWVATVLSSSPLAKIFLDGKDVTGTTQPVLIGQRIGLTASLPGFAQRDGSTFWTVEGNTVGGFSVSTSYEEPDMGAPLPADFTKSGTVFFWIERGFFRVTLAYTLDGVPYAVSTDFNVDGPDPSNVSVNHGYVNITYSHTHTDRLGIVHRVPYLQLGGKDNNIGVTFERTPTSNSGTFEWLQLIDGIQIEKYEFGKFPSSCTVSNGLDTQFPYGDANVSSTDDNPGVPLQSPHLIVSEVMSARMYLLWNPSLPSGCLLAGTSNGNGTCTSISVPQGYVDWSWSGAAGYSLRYDDWEVILPLSSFNATAFEKTSTFPSWMRAVNGSNICANTNTK